VGPHFARGRAPEGLLEVVQAALDEREGTLEGGAILAVRVGDVELAHLADGVDAAARARPERLDRLLLARLHDEDEVELTQQVERELSRAVAGEVEAAVAHEVLRVLLRRLAHERGDAGRLDRRREATLAQPMGEEDLGHRAPADVAGADHEDAGKHEDTASPAREVLPRSVLVVEARR